MCSQRSCPAQPLCVKGRGQISRETQSCRSQPRLTWSLVPDPWLRPGHREWPAALRSQLPKALPLQSHLPAQPFLQRLLNPLPKEPYVCVHVCASMHVHGAPYPRFLYPILQIFLSPLSIHLMITNEKYFCQSMRNRLNQCLSMVIDKNWILPSLCILQSPLPNSRVASLMAVAGLQELKQQDQGVGPSSCTFWQIISHPPPELGEEKSKALWDSGGLLSLNTHNKNWNASKKDSIVG